MAKWEIKGFTLVGSSHQSDGLPCQDNYKVRQTKNTRWTAICISDGAGSAIYSEKSSKFTVEKFSESLLVLGETIDKIGYGSWINDYLAKEIIKLREGIRHNNKTSELADFNCTLVALLIGEEVSITIHVGDGAIVSGVDINAQEEEYVLNSKLYISYPKNGQNSNETFFVTEPLWFKDIQIKHFGKIDWFLMGSDGGIELFCEEKTRLDGALVSEVIGNLRTKTQSKTNLSKITNRPELIKRTSDDICCVIGYRPNFKHKEKHFHWDDDDKKKVFLESQNFKERNKKLRENRRKFLEGNSQKELSGEMTTANKIEKTKNSKPSRILKETLLKNGPYDKFLVQLLNEFKGLSIPFLSLIVFVFILTITSIGYITLTKETKLQQLSNDIQLNKLELENKVTVILQQEKKIDAFKQSVKSFYTKLKFSREENRELSKSLQTKVTNLENLNLELQQLSNDIQLNKLELENKVTVILQQEKKIDALKSKLIGVQDNENALLKRIKKMKSVAVQKDEYIEQLKTNSLSMSEDLVLLKSKLQKLESDHAIGLNNE